MRTCQKPVIGIAVASVVSIVLNHWTHWLTNVSHWFKHSADPMAHLVIALAVLITAPLLGCAALVATVGGADGLVTLIDRIFGPRRPLPEDPPKRE